MNHTCFDNIASATELPNALSTGKIYGMKKKIIYFFVIAIFAACSKSAPEKTVIPAALEKVIADNSNCTCEPYIDQYQWKGTTVYLLAYTGPTCSWIPTYFDKDGIVFTMPAGYSLNDFLQESTSRKPVWKCGQGYL